MIPALYQTWVMKKYQHDRLLSAVTKAHLYSPFPSLTTASGRTMKHAVMVVPNDDADGVPTFTQPLKMTLPGNATPVWVIDGRSFLRQGTPPVVVATNDWTFQCVRLALTDVAEADQLHPVRMGLLPAKVFSRWIVQALTSRFNLDVGTQLAISMVACFYYFQMVSNERLEKENLLHYASHVANITGTSREQASALVESMNALYTIDDMIAEFKRVTQSTRLKELNFTGLFTVLSMSWVGVHSRENIAVALEHAPTFLAMVYSAGNDRSFRKTVIARQVESAGRGSEVQSYLKYINRLIGQYFEDGRGF